MIFLLLFKRDTLGGETSPGGPLSEPQSPCRQSGQFFPFGSFDELRHASPFSIRCSQCRASRALLQNTPFPPPPMTSFVAAFFSRDAVKVYEFFFFSLAILSASFFPFPLAYVSGERTLLRPCLASKAVLFPLPRMIP